MFSVTAKSVLSLISRHSEFYRVIRLVLWPKYNTITSECWTFQKQHNIIRISYAYFIILNRTSVFLRTIKTHRPMLELWFNLKRFADIQWLTSVRHRSSCTTVDDISSRIQWLYNRVWSVNTWICYSLCASERLRQGTPCTIWRDGDREAILIPYRRLPAYNSHGQLRSSEISKCSHLGDHAFAASAPRLGTICPCTSVGLIIIRRSLKAHLFIWDSGA